MPTCSVSTFFSESLKLLSKDVCDLFWSNAGHVGLWGLPFILLLFKQIVSEFVAQAVKCPANAAVKYVIAVRHSNPSDEVWVDLNSASTLRPSSFSSLATSDFFCAASNLFGGGHQGKSRSLMVASKFDGIRRNHQGTTFALVTPAEQIRSGTEKVACHET